MMNLAVDNVVAFSDVADRGPFQAIVLDIADSGPKGVTVAVNYQSRPFRDNQNTDEWVVRKTSAKSIFDLWPDFVEAVRQRNLEEEESRKQFHALRLRMDALKSKLESLGVEFDMGVAQFTFTAEQLEMLLTHTK